MKNAFLKIFVRFLQKIIPKNPSQNRILVVSTTALGDTLWATPCIESIRKEKPSCYLAVLTSPIGLEVFKNNPYVDDLFLFKKTFGFFLWKMLYRKNFDTIFLLHASQRTVLPLCSLLGASKIIGSKGINKGLDSLLTHPVTPQYEHEIQRRLKLLEQANISPKTEELSFFLEKIVLPPKSALPKITLHPGSKDAFKRWPKENFIRLGKRIKEQIPCELFISGTEKELVDEIAKAIPDAKKLDPTLSLHQFAEHLFQSDLLITNDTGPVHLACALKKKVIALYVSTDPLLCGPHKAKEATIISRKATCTPCLKRKCTLPFCFFQISVDEVFRAIFY